MSGCFLGPYTNYDPPVDCPVELYELHNASVEPPVAGVVRNNTWVDVTGTFEDLGTSDLTVDVYTVDCDGQPIAHTTRTDVYHHWRITLTGATPGDDLHINGTYAGKVQASGTCPAPLEPDPTCSGMYDWSECEGEGSGSGSGSDTNMPGDDDVGCNAVGAPGLAFALIALGVFARRRCERTR